MVPVLGWAIEEFGWRQASVMVGIFVVVVGIPVASIMRHRPEQYGLLPDGEKPEEPRENSEGRQLVPDLSKDFTAREALGTSSFWFLSLSIMARSLVSGGVGLHLVPYFMGLGANPVQAATYAGSVGVISIPGRFGLSYLGDYFNRRYMMVGSLVLMTVSIVMLARSESIGDSVPAIILYSVSQGGISVIPQALMRTTSVGKLSQQFQDFEAQYRWWASLSVQSFLGFSMTGLEVMNGRLWGSRGPLFCLWYWYFLHVRHNEIRGIYRFC